MNKLTATQKWHNINTRSEKENLALKWGHISQSTWETRMRMLDKERELIRVDFEMEETQRQMMLSEARTRGEQKVAISDRHRNARIAATIGAIGLLAGMEGKP